MARGRKKRVAERVNFILREKIEGWFLIFLSDDTRVRFED